MEGDWPRTGREMATKVRSFDWSATPLGPISSWPAELKSTAALVLESGFPAALVWGPELVTIYNDGFRPILGDKPEALGRSFAEIWSEVWAEIGPIVDRAFSGESTFIENFPLVINRSGKPEQACFTFSYSPVRAADGVVVGMIDTVVETTRQVRAEQALRDSEERLRRSLESMTDAVYIGTAEGITFANQSALAQLGFDSIDELKRDIHLIIEEMETRAWPTGEILRPDQHAFVRALGGEEVVLEVSVRHRRTGELRFLRSAASPLILNGEIAGAIAMNTDITERVRAEEALRASEALLSVVFESLPVGVGVVDAAGMLILSNPKMRRYWPTGIVPSRDDARHMRWRAYHRDGRPVARQDFPSARALRGESVLPGLEMLYTQDDGGEVWTRVAAVPIRDGDGRITGAVAVVTDIDVLKRTTEALRASEARLKAATDLVGLSSYTWHPLTGALAWDARLKAMWGLSPEAHVDQELWWSAIHPVDRPLVDAALAACTDPAGDGVYRVEYRVIGIEDGVERWVSSYGRTTFANGRPVGFIGAVIETTERKQVEQALRESEARLAAVFDALPVGVGFVDRTGTMLLSNREMQRYLPTGLMPSWDDARRWRWCARHPDGRPVEPESFPGARALSGERVVPGLEMLYTDDDNREIWTRVAAVPVSGGQEVVVGQIAVVTDIDALKRAQETQKILIAELQHRTRNLLGLVRRIARRTLKASASLEEFARDYDGRLAALSRVQGLLSRDSGYSAGLREVIAGELAPYVDGSGRVRIEGPDVQLSARAVQTLTLALHELATNAVKHGGLAGDGAKLAVTWQVEAGEAAQLVLTWAETGVRLVHHGTLPQQGFGSYLVERVLPTELDAETRMVFAPDGLRCEIRLPLDEDSRA